MFSRYNDKCLRITTEDGSVFTGAAEALPSGYGLHEFGRAEESLQIGDVILFKSDIKTIEVLPDIGSGGIRPGQFDGMMGNLLEGPYWIADILPEQVPETAGGQYFAVERFFLQPERLAPLRRRFASILLRLNCYFDMAVSFDSCVSWEANPDPERFGARLTALSGNDFLRAVFAEQNAMIDIEHDDTYMTVYDPDDRLLDKLRKLAAAEGLFLWRPPER